MAHGCNPCILSGDIVVDLLVVEAGEAGSNVVAFAHFEVFTEVLVTAPPIGVNHAEALVASDLMEVGVTHIVLLAVHWETHLLVGEAVLIVGLSNSVAEVLNHLLLLVLYHDVEEEGLVQVEDQAAPHESDAVLFVEGAKLPVGIANWVFEEASDVLESSPLLGVVAGLLGVQDELGEVTIGLLGKRSKNYKNCTYLPIMSARSLMLGTPYIRPSIPVRRWRKCDLGFSLS